MMLEASPRGDRVSLHEKFGKGWRRLSALTTSGDRLARIESQLSSTLNRLEPLLARAQLDRELEKIARSDPKRLELHGFRGLSQYDADGILAEIFRRIGEKHRSFVEFGRGDGLENNTAYLLGQGWHGLWLVGCDIVGLNAFFVREDLCGDRFSPGNARTFWRPRSWWLDCAFATAPAPFGHPHEER